MNSNCSFGSGEIIYVNRYMLLNFVGNKQNNVETLVIFSYGYQLQCSGKNLIVILKKKIIGSGFAFS